VFYSGVLKGTLKEYMDQATGQPPHEQLKIFDELNLVRHVNMQVVALYQAAYEAYTNEQDSKQKELRLQSLMQAGLMMRDCCDQVTQLADRAAKIESNLSGKVSVHDIGYVVNQIVRIMYRTVEEQGAPPTLAVAFEQMVNDEVKLPGIVARGTLITPDQDVLDMDSTIPEEDEDNEFIEQDTSDGDA
jgi:hypothetical protein